MMMQVESDKVELEVEEGLQRESLKPYLLIDFCGGSQSNCS